jgi:hypothetical protein
MHKLVGIVPNDELEVNGWTPKIMDKTKEMNKCEKELNLAIRHGV